MALLMFCLTFVRRVGGVWLVVYLIVDKDFRSLRCMAVFRAGAMSAPVTSNKAGS